MKIGKAGLFVSLMILVFGGIAISDAMGLWNTESTKEPVKIATGEFKGLSDPNDIRGSYTFADIERSFGVNVASLAEAFAIEGTDEEKAAYKCNGLEELYAGLSQEIGTDSVRLFVGLATGLPVDKGAYLPETASSWLSENVKLSDEDKQYLASHTIDTDEKAAEAMDEKAPESTPEIVAAPEAIKAEVKETSLEAVVVAAIKEVPKTAETAPETSEAAPVITEAVQAIEPTVEHEQKQVGSVKGSTTIWDVMQWGVAREEIGPAIGIELPDDNGAKLRDLVIAAGKSFDDAKVILQDLVDKASGK